MTTGNRIITAQEETALFLPSECIHKNDSLTYVYMKQDRKTIRKEVIAGIFNENETVITAGLEEGAEVFLSKPQQEVIAVELLDEAIKNSLLANEQVSTQP